MRPPRLPGPDFRPSRADADARRVRKALEKENPHFNMVQEFGMKVGMLALLMAVALFPWEKEYEAHERRRHVERFESEERNNGRGGGKGDDGDDGEGEEGWERGW